MLNGKMVIFLSGGKMQSDFKLGDRVESSPMWKYPKATGTVIKITKEYTVVEWDGINGHWHYTLEQAKKIQRIEDDERR